MNKEERQVAEEFREKKTTAGRIRDYMVISAAALFYAAAVSLFLDPNNLAPGGVTGIAILLNRLTGIAVGTLVLVINIPILLLGLWKFGFRFLCSTVYATVLSSCFINLLRPCGALTGEPILAALAGGVLVAGALGFIFRAGATTGGMDIVVKLLRIRYPHLKTGALFFMTDMTIVLLSGLVFRNIDTVLYAMLAVLVTSLLFDVVLYGRDEAKLIYIISDRPQAIGARLLEEIGAGATYLTGKGAYSEQEKQVIFCVLRKQLAPKAEDIVKEEDPYAFMIVTSATEIYGEGYKNLFSEKL